MNTDLMQPSDALEAKLPSEASAVPAPGACSMSESSKTEVTEPEVEKSEAVWTDEKWSWSPEGFARAQLRGLVQQTFFSASTRRVRQVVISGAESRADVSGICRQLGEILAQETSANVVVAAGDFSCLAVGDAQFPDTPKRDPLAIRVGTNLWLTPGLGGTRMRREMLTSTGWGARLCELRREFEYSILEGPAVGESSDSAMAAQVADGLILVLRAHGTRRAAVQWIQQMLQSTQTHLLGTILAERRFPIPQGIYRWL